jgi:hypothetical protein
MTTADDAYWTIRQRVLDEARKSGTEIREKPSAALSSMTVYYPEPLAGIRAARTYEHAAARLAADYVSCARADGISWLEIGKASGLSGESDCDVMTAAYERAAGTSSLSWQATFTFTCGSCGKRVTDRGPYVASPLDQEEGHADSCTRLAEAVRAYRAQWGEDDA